MPSIRRETDGNILFKETQKFNILYISAIGFALFFGVIGILQIIWNISLLTHPEPSWLLITFLIGSVLCALFCAYQQLIITITKEAFVIDFGVSGETIIKIKDVKTISIRKYNALKEFGGWGVRNNSYESCFTVSGNIAVEIELNSNEKMLIGTKKPEQIKDILDEYCKSF